MLRLHGIVEAVQAYTATAPQLAGPAQSGPGGGALIITKLARSGQMVKRGDLLAEFDRQNQIKNALDREAEYRDLEEQIKKKQADQTSARAKDETELAQAENAVGVAKLEMQKNEVIARINAEKNQLTLEETTARWKQLQETFELKRRAAQAEIRVLEIQRDRARDAMRYAESNAGKMSIRAPQDGLTVVSTVWNNQKEQMAEVQEGEEVRPGSPVLQVVNPRGMQVRVRVNQADLAHLQIGQTAQVILDAYPDSSLPARLEQVAPVGIASNFSEKVHTFISLFSVQASDPRLIPDLSAAVEVQLECRPDALVVPRDAVSVENGQSFVQVKNGSGLERRAVKIGPASDWEVVIESGVAPGTVLLRNVTDSSSRT
jgi:multidrug efflux pump subunit AcrA (membrane-fusion protein)